MHQVPQHKVYSYSVQTQIHMVLIHGKRGSPITSPLVTARLVLLYLTDVFLLQKMTLLNEDVGL